MVKRSLKTLKDSKASTTQSVLFEVFVLNPQAHTFRVRMTIDSPCRDQEFNFPQWIAGSYMIRDFSKHLHNLSAKQNGKSVAYSQLSKSSWRVHCKQSSKLTLEYDIYAHDPSVRGAWLDNTRGFFNGTSLFFECTGLENTSHYLKLHKAPIATQYELATEKWSVYTSLDVVKTDNTGWGLYIANSFEDLVDTPVLMSNAWLGEFEISSGPHKVKHQLVLNGISPSFDGERLVSDTQNICQTIVDFWHKKSKPVIQKYLFIVNVVQDGYGGLEHKSSTVLQCKRSDLPIIHKTEASEGYVGLLGLISHEYFHTWNVKRLRPLELSKYDFNTENYTQMLWFFEGFTSYYDDLLLRRSGLISDQQYLKILNKTIQQVIQTPGRKVQSVAESSFDAWVKYYKPDENTPNLTVSYYTKGAMIALCFDLKLRAHNTSLDAVMRELFKRSSGGPISEDDFKSVLEELSHRHWDAELRDWVHGVEDPPYALLLQNQGIKVEHSADSLQQQLGLRTDESKSGVHIKVVLTGGPGEQAGFVPGDEWIGVEVPDESTSKSKSKAPTRNFSEPGHKSCWRIQKLDDLFQFVRNAKFFDALVCRDQQLILLRVPYNIRLAMSDKNSISLSVAESAKVKQWLLNH